MMITKLAQKLRRHSPLILIIFIALLVALQNIKWGSYYSGWDNIHAEFNLGRYARQVFFGAWLEHQGLGAPAGQGQLSEIPRLPIILILKLLVPDNLVRYTFIFSTYLTGGIGVYLYLIKVWLNKSSRPYRQWLACLGSVFYLLHVLTLQQFYISFELFVVQFAFLPFLLLVIHRLAKQINSRTLLLFILIQLLIAPSGHTPTVFYFGMMLSLVYAFFLKLNQGIGKALTFSFLVGLLTFLTNAYWILPNVYYGLHDARYVQQSWDNKLFGPESLWSVREAGNLSNLISGRHYLFSWKDYSFAKHQFEYIFAEWLQHFSQPLVVVLLHWLGALTIFGLIVSLVDKEKDAKRVAILLIYLFCLAFIWIDLFPTKIIFDLLYQSNSFLEAFRNPFTKLSVIYSFVSVLLFIQASEFLVARLVKYLKRIQLGAIKIKSLTVLTIFGCILAVIYTAWPAFQGQFISEKLKVKYPPQYQQLFDYLQTRDRDLRILQLPQLSHAGWLYHDWSFIEPGNGYQGMGFNFFGFPQPILNRDSDRWVETGDFFYHELKYALDTQNLEHFKQILAKYRVDLVLVDETKVEPTTEHDYQRDHQLLAKADLTKVWQQDFLTIYERSTTDQEQALFVPQKLNWVQAQMQRVKRDVVYQNQGDYLLTDQHSNTTTLYPFANLLAKELTNVTFTPDGAEIHQQVKSGNYQVILPGMKENIYFTPAMIQYQNQLVKVKFPVNKVTLAVAGQGTEQEIILPKFSDFEFMVEEDYPALIVFFNDQGIIIERDKTIYPVLVANTYQPILVAYSGDPDQIKLIQTNQANLPLQAVQTLELNPDWPQWYQDQTLQVTNLNTIKLTTEFPTFPIDLSQSPSLNCSSPLKGIIATETFPDKLVYQAENFGVNCNSYDFDFESSSYSYLINIVGNNLQGRSSKFFIHFSDQEFLFEDYLLPANQCDVFLTLPQVSSNPLSEFIFNWETRSFGKTSTNELSKIQLIPFPLLQLAQLRLEPKEALDPDINELEIELSRLFLDFVYVAEFSCQQQQCYLGLDQTYDDLWLAFKSGEAKLLPHYRYNNWGNVWEVAGQGRVIIFYLPELISLTSFSLLMLGTALLLIQSLRQSAD